MSVATTEAINDARQAVIALFDAVRPWLDDPIPREVVVEPYEAALAALHTALYEATTAKAMGCEINPADEHGTGHLNNG